LKGGIPTSNSNKMTPTDHQSAVYAAKFEQIFCRCYVCNKIHKNTGEHFQVYNVKPLNQQATVITKKDLLISLVHSNNHSILLFSIIKSLSKNNFISKKNCNRQI